MRVFALVRDNPPLEQNSLYCNLLQCSHFADTAVLAEQEGRVVGFITGFRKPADPETVFAWQVAVDAGQRGRGIAGQLLAHLMENCRADGVRFLEASVTPDNRASMTLFERFAEKRDVPLAKSDLFTRDKHFNGTHETEVLLRIGPLD